MCATAETQRPGVCSGGSAAPSGGGSLAELAGSRVAPSQSRVAERISVREKDLSGPAAASRPTPVRGGEPPEARFQSGSQLVQAN